MLPRCMNLWLHGGSQEGRNRESQRGRRGEHRVEISLGSDRAVDFKGGGEVDAP